MLISYPHKKTLPATFQVFHRTLTLQTRECLQFIDLTEEIVRFVRNAKITHGIVNIQTHHTTASIIINENEPLLLNDLKRSIERFAPRDASYQHDDFAVRTENLTPDEQPNGHAHCKALALKASETLNIINGELQLGRWQRVFFVELDCARERTVSVVAMGLVK